MEVWVDIAEYDNYQVSNHGNMQNKKTGRVLRPASDKYGHQQVRLSKNGLGRNMRVHRLVLYAFVGECPVGMECRHLDGDATNNHISNLRWGTPLENVADMIMHGTHVDNRGEAHGRSRLTEEQVIEIRNLGGTLSRLDIAKRFGVHQVHIGHIQNRKRWKHI